MKFGAIDIGSNAVRLLIARVEESEEGRLSIDKLSFYRVPVRLGADVFSDGAISEGKIKHLVKTMKAFWYLWMCTGWSGFSYATSAMREATNVEAVIKKVKKAANIAIEPISGDREAELIFGNCARHDGQLEGLPLHRCGGGARVDPNQGRQANQSKSFQIGTVRELAGRLPDGEWTAVQAYVSDLQDAERPLYAIGTGGNANRLQRLALTPRDEAIPMTKLAQVANDLAKLTVEERRRTYHLKPDRADVIVPAANMYLEIMNMAGASHMVLPKVGLVDGMVLGTYQEWKAEQAS